MPIGHAFEIRNHLRLPISQTIREKMEGEYPYYGPTGIQGYINEYRAEGEHALIGEDGDHVLKWDVQSMTLLVGGRFNVNNHAHIIKGSTNLTSWFYYYFSNKNLTRYLTRQGAGRYKLTKSALLEIPCALPPTKAEQEAISEALSDADAFTESLEKLIAKKRAIKQGAMQELLTGKKRLPGFETKPGTKQTEVGVIPVDWELVRLKNICNLITKGTTPTSIGRSFETSGINFLKAESISDDGRIIPEKSTFIDIETQTLLKRSQLTKGDLLISIAGVLGRVGIVDPMDLPANTNQALAIVRLNSPSGADRTFIFYFLRSAAIKNQIRDINVQAAQANISLQNVGDFQIALPLTKAEQKAIGEALADMDSEISALEAKLIKARQIKQGMMHNLLTGRIRLV